MKRFKSVWAVFLLATLLLILFWTSLSSKTQGGRYSLHLKEAPSSTQTAVVQPQTRASNLILVEFFAGY